MGSIQACDVEDERNFREKPPEIRAPDPNVPIQQIELGFRDHISPDLEVRFRRVSQLLSQIDGPTGADFSPGAYNSSLQLREACFNAVKQLMVVKPFIEVNTEWTKLEDIEVVKIGRGQHTCFVPTKEITRYGNQVFEFTVAELRKKRVNFELQFREQTKTDDHVGDAENQANLGNCQDLQSEEFENKSIKFVSRNLLSAMRVTLKDLQEKLIRSLILQEQKLRQQIQFIYEKYPQNAPQDANIPLTDASSAALKEEISQIRNAILTRLCLNSVFKFDQSWTTAAGNGNAELPVSEMQKNRYMFGVCARISALLIQLAETISGKGIYSQNQLFAQSGLFFSRCPAQYCLNPMVYTWVHKGEGKLEPHLEVFEFILVERLQTGELRHKNGANELIEPLTYWKFACPQHPGDYRPPR